jgi:hypothetical protein
LGLGRIFIVLVSQYASEPSHAHAYYLCIGSLLDKEQKGGDFFLLFFIYGGGAAAAAWR